MTLAPLLAAPLAVQIHLAAALAALLIGPVAICRTRRDGLHKAAGYLWIAVMALLATSGFFISGLAVVGPFGPIHLLSVWVLCGLWQGLHAARRGRIAEHRATFRGLYFGAIGLAGLFTLLPGRRLNTALFADRGGLGLLVIGGVLATIVLWRVLARRGRARPAPARGLLKYRSG